jgi:hypothetical protein
MGCTVKMSRYLVPDMVATNTTRNPTKGTGAGVLARTYK